MVEWQAQCLEDATWKDAVVNLLLGEAYGAHRPMRTTWSVRGWQPGLGLMAYYMLVVRLLRISYYEGGQTAAEALAMEGTWDEVDSFEGWSTSSSLSSLCASERSCEQENRSDASLDHLRPQHRVTLPSQQILHAYQRAATIEEMIKFGNEAEVALSERLASTYTAQADTPPEGRPAKAATKRSAPDQIGKGTRRHISVTEIPPAPTKKRGPQSPCKN